MYLPVGLLERVDRINDRMQDWDAYADDPVSISLQVTMLTQRSFCCVTGERKAHAQRQDDVR